LSPVVANSYYCSLSWNQDYIAISRIACGVKMFRDFISEKGLGGVRIDPVVEDVSNVRAQTARALYVQTEVRS
tara:strand:+ start:387 stop:605 length:219 start_codon:yes stop_codon:yes gene_type:complete